MAPDPLKPSATPPGSKAAIADIFSLVDMSTVEEQNSSSQSWMEEYEVPTAPPSPSLAPELPDRPSPKLSDEFYGPDVDI